MTRCGKKMKSFAANLIHVLLDGRVARVACNCDPCEGAAYNKVIWFNFGLFILIGHRHLKKNTDRKNCKRRKDKTFKLIFTALNQKVERRPSIFQVRRGQPLNPAQLSIRWMVCYLVPIPYLFSSFTEWARLQHLRVSQKIQI